ncbi:AAA family ATPase [Macrococcoides caseolyticum]|uniref:AAA family ATPase n=1 Tax=Macrococcoides caseolyticum TaxID=69966 RepID=UPI001F2BC046|nr:AAA family ATPase [Macrococcus caseolyticus]MCE4957664.1 AAA family ATPase [Macrococcus caseolyticus]
MKIKSLEIYGYGRLEHRKFDFQSDFIQIYGENETGKSTMQAFIHALLFGFPKEGEYEPRLEPRFAPQYGGKMILTLNSGETLSIERNFVHHKEEVIILLDDKPKDGAWLSQLLNHITKETYKNIFSFDVLGLQEVHRKLTEDKLQAYLLQAGAFGSTEFTQMTEHISAEKERLFNNDATGEIDKATESLQAIESEIREKDHQFEMYQSLLNEQDKLNRSYSEYESHLNELKDVLKRKQREIRYHDQAKEWKALEHQLNIEPPTFPEQGITRYESLKKQKVQVGRDLALREERLDQITTENTAIELLDSAFITQSNALLKEEQAYRNNQSDLTHQANTLEQMKKEQQVLMQEIGWSHNPDVALHPSMHEKASVQINQQEKDLLEKAQVDREFNFANEAILKKEQAAREIEKTKVHDERFDKALQLEHNKAELLDKSKLYETMKEEALSFEQSQMKKYQFQQTGLILMLIVFIASAIYAYMLPQYIVLAVFSILAVVTIVMMVMNKKPAIEFNQALQKEVDDLTFKVKDLQENFDLSFDLDEQRTIRQRLTEHTNDIQREKERQHMLAKDLENINKRIDATTNVLNLMKQELKLPDDYLINRLTLAVKQINKINQLEQEMKRIYSKQQHIESSLAAFTKKVEILNQLSPVALDIETLFHDLKTMHTKDEKNRFNLNKNNEQIVLLNKEINILQEQLEQTEQALLQLFEEAKVDNESAYYEREKEYLSYHEQLKQFEHVGNILTDQGFTYEDNSELSFVTSVDLMEQQSAIEAHIATLIEKQNEIKDALKNHQEQLDVIAADDSLSKLKYEYVIKKNQLNELIKTYTSVNYIETLVDAHIEGVKEKRLPFVVKDATEIFKYLTEGRYISVNYKDNHLAVKAIDGQVYHPTELSQSTKEILYIALRLSLIQSLNKYYPFPIIIDDAFVHFDRKRRERILEYMMKLKTNQIIYYTCNRSTAVNHKNTITLERINKEVKK